LLYKPIGSVICSTNKMRSFYITLQSDSSGDYYPHNTITDFYNKFTIPVKVPPDQYQVALVECSYIPSGIIVKKGEKICKYNGIEHVAEVDFYSLDDLINHLKIPSKDFDIKSGYAYARYDTGYDHDRFLRKLRKHKKEQLGDLNSIHPVLVTRLNDGETHVTKKYVVEWSPRIALMFGMDEETNTYVYPILSQVSATNLYVYTDIVESQRVGHQMVPLLRKITNSGQRNQLTTHEFTHLEYKNLSLHDFDTIHCYIRTEAGEPPSIEVGTFSATLHFRPKPQVHKYGRFLHNIAI
jgi:hypothetical protein